MAPDGRLDIAAIATPGSDLVLETILLTIALPSASPCSLISGYPAWVMRASRTRRRCCGRCSRCKFVCQRVVVAPLPALWDEASHHAADDNPWWPDGRLRDDHGGCVIAGCSKRRFVSGWWAGWSHIDRAWRAQVLGARTWRASEVTGR